MRLVSEFDDELPKFSVIQNPGTFRAKDLSRTVVGLLDNLVRHIREIDCGGGNWESSSVVRQIYGCQPQSIR